MSRRRLDWKRWRRPIVVTATGSAVFGLSIANGHGLELLWLPAVLLGASWPYRRTDGLRSCLHPLRKREEQT
jgi:hypothetical protein